MNWSLVFTGFDARQEGLREALCTLGNGYFATRGAATEVQADAVHYPGTYLAGGYNRLTTDIAGQIVENEDLVNVPNWLPLNFRIMEDDWFSLESLEILDYRQELDLKRGLLTRTVRFCDSLGRRTRLRQRRLVHMRYPHLAAIETTLSAENWSGRLDIRSALDGRIGNTGVMRYRGLNSKHLEPLAADAWSDDLFFLLMQTKQSRIAIAQAARTRIFRNGAPIFIKPTMVCSEPGYVAQQFSLPMAEGEQATVEKTLALFTSRDQASSECALEARKTVARAGQFAELLDSHALAWQQLWRRFDMEIELKETAASQNGHAELILRLHMFHLLQTASLNTLELDVGVPARGLHGEAYRGHIFWDELFIFPLLNLRLPEITRALLKYRFRRLDEARAMAREAGYRGAMYPWQSGSDGREESQKLHLNPQSGRWIPDRSCLQRHVNAAVAYNIWQYYQVTADMEFMAFYGAEMFLEIARFWASLAHYNERLDRYEILGVMGPDEYHDGYPDVEEGGLNNNAYTNVMAVWVLSEALDLLKRLPDERCQELREMLGLSQEELALWDTISRKMRLVFHSDEIISQFEGYEQLQDFDWPAYRKKYGDIQRLDRILEAEGDSPNRYQVSKQADVLMLFYLFSADKLSQLFARLGYAFTHATIPKNVNYYIKHSSHGSTLSRVVHSWVLARWHRAESWKLFTEALESDVADVQGGTTPEGIHLGAMAGTVDVVQRCYAGIAIHDDVLCFDPLLPHEVARLKMRLHYRGHNLDLQIMDGTLRITVGRSPASAIRIGVGGAYYELRGGEIREFT